MKKTLLMILVCMSLNCQAQIHLNGYKCKYYKDQEPNTVAEMYNTEDTFHFSFLSRDVDDEMDGASDPVKELKVGLDLAFGKSHYTTTKDSLYICTYKNDRNVYYYKIYVPNQRVCLSVRSKNNDSLFADKSKWLLSQIRLNRKKDLYLVNEKGQTCQAQDEDR